MAPDLTKKSKLRGVARRSAQWMLAGMLGLSITSGADEAQAAAQQKQPFDRKDRTEPLPKRLETVDVKEHLDTALPRGVEFTDEHGKRVKLGDYFDGKVPVVLTLNYSSCPMLCSLQLGGLVNGLKQVDWTAGQEYRLVTVSIDPDETAATAKKTQARYLQQYGRPEAEGGWHFLTGKQESIHAVAKALGFSYAYNEKRDEYAHPAAIALATPNGKIARYLYGIEYAPKTLRLSLVESSEGKIGTTVDRILLYCFHYDSSDGRYAPFARNIMRLGGALTVLILGAVLALFWRAELRKRRSGESKAS
jgi:protein SCO1/2